MISEELAAALRGLGVEPNDTQKVIIEIEVDGTTKIYTQARGDQGAVAAVLAVVEAPVVVS